MTNWIKKNTKDILFFVGLVLAVWLTYRVGTYTELQDITTMWNRILLIMVLFIILASALITGNFLFGWLINAQNRMSLSRLQMFLWTVVILSAFVTAVFANLKYDHIDVATAIQIPQELWLAMGISTTSLVGTGLILESKKDKKPKELELRKVQRNGVLERKDDPSLLDLIRGEEITNSDKIDLTRLQNLLFTFVLVGVYMANLSTMFLQIAEGTPIADQLPIEKFPPLGSSEIALLTISHAGYLIAKAVDKQPSEENDETDNPEDPVG